MVDKHVLYGFGDKIFVGVTYSYSESDRVWRGPGYVDGIPFLEPKLKYFRQSVRKLNEFESDSELKKQDICAYITFEQSAKKTYDLGVDVKKTPKKTYLDVKISGDLIELESVNLGNQINGIRSRDLESIIGRVVNLASAREGYMALHGGATVDEKNKEIYFIVSNEHKTGKTTILFNFLQQGHEFISNNLRLKLSPKGKITIYPQFFPKVFAVTKAPSPDNYATLKQSGFPPAGRNIEEIPNKDAEIPLSAAESLLRIPTIKDKRDVTEDYKLIVIWPKPAPELAKLDNLRIFEPPTYESAIESVWKATWDFGPVYDELKIKDRTDIESKLLEYRQCVVEDRKFIPVLAKKIGKLFFEVGGNYSLILPMVKSRISELYKPEPAASAIKIIENSSEQKDEEE